MMRWRWQGNVVRKFEVRVVVRGIDEVEDDGDGEMTAELTWKGGRMTALRSLGRRVRRNRTREEGWRDGRVEWNEEFWNVVEMTWQRENAFSSWDLHFLLFHGTKQKFKNKTSIVGMTSLNLADYVSSSGEEIELNLPLSMAVVNVDSPPILHLNLKMLELRSSSESPEIAQRHVVPSSSSSPPSDASYEKDELSALKAGLRKVKILTNIMSTRRSKKNSRDDEGSDGRCSNGSEDTDYTYQFDSDSLDDNPPDEELEDWKGDVTTTRSLCYGSLSNANYVDGVLHCDTNFNGEYEDCVYGSSRRYDVEFPSAEEAVPSISEQQFIPKRSILPWRKRKYNIRSPKAKGEPLLKKAYGEEGGDDIDYDRRQMTSSDESSAGLGIKVDDETSTHHHHTTCSNFGDDNFAVGRWEAKSLASRDGKLNLSTEVFFASIDQRSERAAGQSACTALVAIIADWLNSNHDMMPIKSQFDALIREGSMEWRKLCENQTYINRFPDKHFDLETIIQARIRPLSLVPNKSFVGFFHPKGFEDNVGFEFLRGAMSFDDMWDEIIAAGTSNRLYIVGWNDHFFVLRVDADAYYIIDTLGERLYEGCDMAYILKFDHNTTIHSNSNQAIDDQLVCIGKESCKEYIKSFMAAIPIRELEADIDKGFVDSAPIHRRLQIEFYFTEAATTNDVAAISPLPFFEPASRISAAFSAGLLAT